MSEDEESRYSDMIAGWPEAQRQVISRFLELRDARHEAERSAAYRAGVGVGEWMRREEGSGLVVITCPNCGADHTDRGQLAASIICSCGYQFSFVRPGRTAAYASGFASGAAAQRAADAAICDERAKHYDTNVDGFIHNEARLRLRAENAACAAAIRKAAQPVADEQETK